MLPNLPFFHKGQLFEPLTMVFIPKEELETFMLPEGVFCRQLSTLEPELWVDDKFCSNFKGFGQTIFDNH